MKKFIRNMVKRIVRKLFGSKAIQFCFEEIIRGGRVGGVLADAVIVSSSVLHHDLDDFVCKSDYDFDSFISSDDYDLDDFVCSGDHDFDEMVTTRDFNPDDYVTQTNLDDQMDGFDPDDFVRCEDFDPDDYVRCQDCDPDDFVYTSDFNPDDYLTNDEFRESLNGYKKSIYLDLVNLEKKFVAKGELQPTQHEVISFLTKLTLCANDYCTEALQADMAEGTTNG